MIRMELGRLLRIETEFGLHPSPVAMEHVLEEIAAPIRIFERTILSQREIGPRLEEHASKDADSVSNLFFVLSEDLHPFCPTARRAAFEDEAVEACFLEFGEPLPGKTLHPLGQILARFRLDQPRHGLVFQESDRRPRHAEPDLDLRTYRHPLEELTEYLSEVAVELVAAVVSDLGSEQAGGNTDSDRLLVVPLPPSGCGFCRLTHVHIMACSGFSHGSGSMAQREGT